MWLHFYTTIYPEDDLRVKTCCCTMILIIITTSNINLCLWCESTTYYYEVLLCHLRCNLSFIDKL